MMRGCRLSILRRSAAGGFAPRAAALSTTPVKESYTERMAKTGRPVSPHVTVYRFPIVSISSITNRVTGVMLSVGVTGIGALTLAGIDSSAVMQMIGSTPVAPIFKFAVAFPLVYHYFGGLRHIVWDMQPDQLTNEDVSKSSYALFGASGALSLVMAFVKF